MDTAKVNPVAIGAALSGTTITVKLGGLGPGGVTLKENKLGFEALGTGPPTSPPSLVRLFPAPQHSLEHGAPSACGAPAWVDLTPRGAWRVRASVRTAHVCRPGVSLCMLCTLPLLLADGLWHSTPLTGSGADSVMVGPAPKGAKAVRYLWYSSPCSPYVGSWPPGKGPAKCAVTLTKQTSDAKCVEGTSFGCYDGILGMWVGDCRGTFECDGKATNCDNMENSRGYGTPGRHNCTCGNFHYYVHPPQVPYHCPVYTDATALGSLSGELDMLPLGPFVMEL